MAIKTGDTARLKQPEIKGTVKQRVIDDDTDRIRLLLEWTEADGTVTQRWFDEDQLEAAE